MRPGARSTAFCTGPGNLRKPRLTGSSSDTRRLNSTRELLGRVGFALAEVLRPGVREAERVLRGMPDRRAAVAVFGRQKLHRLQIGQALLVPFRLQQRPRMGDL